MPKAQESPASLLASFGDQGVEARLRNGIEEMSVLAGTTYYYRVVVADEHGTVPSAEGSFTTLPEHTEAVADDRVWEMVSPPDKEGAGVEIGTPFFSLAGGRVAEAAEDGQALTYVTNGPIGQAEGNRSFEPTQMLSVRGPAGWQESQDIVTPNEHAEGILFGGGSEYRVFSSNLALAVVQPYNVSSRTRLAEPPLSPPTSEAERGHQEKTLYVRADGRIQPQGAQAALYGEAEENGKTMGDAGYGYVALVTAANAPGAQFGSQPPESEPLVTFEGATPDLGHVVLESNVKGTACEPGPLGCVPGLYEWHEGALRLVSRLPNGQPSEPSEGKAILGSHRLVRHAISDDGSRVFWSVKHQHLYMSDTTSEPTQTIQLDTVQSGASGGGEHNPVFQTASPEGSLALFTDEFPLTEGAGATAGKPDLYAYNSSDHTLRDLTPCPRTEEDPEHHQVCVESAEVQGRVLGASEVGCDEGQSGCYVYFVANGVLCERENTEDECEAENAQGEKAAPGDCGAERPADTTCNLYVERREDGAWKPPTFIATLSNADRPDFEASIDNNTTDDMMTSARVSPNGRYLSFMSDRMLTGYDNHDAVTGEADEEVFLYEAGSEGGRGRLVCASCDPSGARPTGVLDLPTQASEVGAGLLVDRNGVWAEHRLAGSLPDWMAETQNVANYQPRYLSNSGRLYFDSPSDLVPQATNGKEDVYEYEPAGVPQGAHRCANASEAYSQLAEGCVALISSGTASGEAAFVDASESGGEGPGGEELAEGGGDVFFVTGAKLVPQDTDNSFDVYDAHECTRAEPCFPAAEERASSVCEGEECRSPASSPPAAASVASGSPSGQGNVPAKQGVSSSKTVKPKPPTRAQELAKALASCREKHKHASKKRASCERAARKHYGSVKKRKPAAKKAKKSDARGGRGRGGAR